MTSESFKKSPGFSFYHPVASVIFSCLEKRINFINRGLFEVKNLQSENFVAEKFAVTTETRLVEGFLRDFFFLQKDVTVLISPSIAGAGEKMKIYESEKPAKYRLLFKPIDSVVNFARGLSECGSFFVLQSILPEGSKKKYEDVFSLFYNFKTQKFLYAENKGLVFFENKRMKALHRKTSLVASCNTAAFLSENLKTEVVSNARIKTIISRGSGMVSDCFDLANGGIDGVIYSKLSMFEAIAINILVNSLACFTTFKLNQESDDLTMEVDFIAGAEVMVKAFK